MSRAAGGRGDVLAAFDGSRAEPFDVLVTGGGATGLGIAVDAATRGFRTALVEAGDFAQATSSRATKLVHGGVRYLASGQVHLVYEALHERAVMMRNAPHLVRPQAFLLPTFTRWELPYFGAGLGMYDLMSGRSTMGPTRMLGRKATLERIPNLATEGLSGGVLYHDGQFNDARLALALARTAADNGAAVANYVRCTRLLEAGGRVCGAALRDELTGAEHEVRARVVFNATGIFTDEVRRMGEAEIAPLLTVSRGTHIVVGAEVLGGSAGIMVPKTADGRVIFAIPWQGRVVIGTTDLPAPKPEMEPGYTEEEIEFLLETVNRYLARRIGREDVLSVFSGLRPLVTGKASKTSKISREHHIDVSAKGLITVAGGKWTTYRRMAEDTLSFASKQGMLERRECRTGTVRLRGWSEEGSADAYLDEYGSDAEALRELMVEAPELGERVDAALPYTFAQVVYGVREEMAYSVEDVLSRRTRGLLLDAKAAVRAAAGVARVMAVELGRDEAWVTGQVREFTELVEADYLLRGE